MLVKDPTRSCFRWFLSIDRRTCDYAVFWKRGSHQVAKVVHDTCPGFLVVWEEKWERTYLSGKRHQLSLCELDSVSAATRKSTLRHAAVQCRAK